MWRLKIFGKLSIPKVYYLNNYYKHLFLYEVINNLQVAQSIDHIIPENCRTIAIQKKSIFVIGGVLINKVIKLNK